MGRLWPTRSEALDMVQTKVDSAFFAEGGELSFNDISKALRRRLRPQIDDQLTSAHGLDEAVAQLGHKILTNQTDERDFVQAAFW